MQNITSTFELSSTCHYTLGLCYHSGESFQCSSLNETVEMHCFFVVCEVFGLVST
jgi:hypothetical protein